LEDIGLNDIQINRQLNRNFFLQYFNNKLMPYNQDTEIFTFKIVKSIENMNFWIVIGFSGNRITYIELENADENLTNDYTNWSNYKVQKKKESHDKWVKKLLGEPDETSNGNLRYDFNWGIVSSYLDPRSGTAAISIRYKYSENN